MLMPICIIYAKLDRVNIKYSSFTELFLIQFCCYFRYCAETDGTVSISASVPLGA